MKVLEDPDRLLRDAQAGCPDVAAIYRVVRRPMYLAVWRSVRPSRSYGGVSDDDVVARAFDELMKNGLWGVDSLVGKARVIAFRRGIDLVRRRSWEEPRDCLEDIEDEKELADELERREQLGDLAAQLIDRLPERQRLVIIETVMKGRSCTAVAGQLDNSPQAVSKCRCKGLKQLATMLIEERWDDETPKGGG